MNVLAKCENYAQRNALEHCAAFLSDVFFNIFHSHVSSNLYSTLFPEQNNLEN